MSVHYISPIFFSIAIAIIAMVEALIRTVIRIVIDTHQQTSEFKSGTTASTNIITSLSITNVDKQNIMAYP